MHIVRVKHLRRLLRRALRLARVFVLARDRSHRDASRVIHDSIDDPFDLFDVRVRVRRVGWGRVWFLYVEFVVCLILAGKGKLTFLRLCFWVLGPLKVWSQLWIEMLSEGFRGRTWSVVARIRVGGS